MKKNHIIAFAAAAVLTLGAISGCGCSNSDAEKTSTGRNTPTFMYYISNSDPDFDKTNEIIQELEDEYSDKVQFKIINIDEASDSSQLLVSAGQTPTLIMTGKTSDTEIKNKCNDKEELKQCIENAIK